MSDQMKRIIEGLLFVSDSPLNLTQLAKILETEDRAQVKEAIAELQTDCLEQKRAYTLAEVAGGYAFRTDPELANWLRKLKKQQAARLSPASLETLAIVAYKQPVLRAEVERLRGVDAGGVLRMLMEKDLINVVGRKDLPGRPLIYGTTKRFLDIFGLKDLKDLPTLEEMEALIGEPEAATVEDDSQGILDLGLDRPATVEAADEEIVEEIVEEPGDTAEEFAEDVPQVQAEALNDLDPVEPPVPEHAPNDEDIEAPEKEASPTVDPTQTPSDA